MKHKSRKRVIKKRAMEELENFFSKEKIDPIAKNQPSKEIIKAKASCPKILKPKLFKIPQL